MSLEPSEKVHRCLEIPEIIEVILNDITQGQGWEEDEKRKATLSALARACQVFHIPAIQLLRRELKHFEAIIGVFPDDIWNDLREQDHDIILVCSMNLRMKFDLTLFQYPGPSFEGRAGPVFQRLQH
jgi:hypothetical protein